MKETAEVRFLFAEEESSLEEKLKLLLSLLLKDAGSEE